MNKMGRIILITAGLIILFFIVWNMVKKTGVEYYKVRQIDIDRKPRP